MCDITTGISRRCLDNVGGVKKFYLMPFADIDFTVSDNVITSFPNSIIYEFVFNGDLSYSNPQGENEGGKYWDENITLKFAKIGVDAQLRNLDNLEFRAIIEDNNGEFRMLGAYNGLQVENTTVETGTSKDSFNGWTIQFTGQEERESLYLTDLAGFTIEGVDYNFIFEDGNNFIFEDNNNFIFN